MKKTDFVFHFHNPNTQEATAIAFLQTAIKANAKRIEEIYLHHISSEKSPHLPIYNKTDEFHA